MCVPVCVCLCVCVFKCIISRPFAMLLGCSLLQISQMKLKHFLSYFRAEGALISGQAALRHAVLFAAVFPTFCPAMCQNLYFYGKRVGRYLKFEETLFV